MILKVKFFGVSWMISSLGKITDTNKKTDWGELLDDK
jgi:hypothetical protein